MGKSIRSLLILLSVSLNVAFILVWAVKTLPRAAAEPVAVTCPPGDSCRVTCPLHRALGTTDAQWAVLGPLQQDFRTASQRSCRDIRRLRAEMLAFLSEPAVPADSVRARQEQILAAQRGVQDRIVNLLLTEKQVLTPGQWTTLLSMLEQGKGCASHGELLGAGRHARACPLEAGHNEHPNQAVH